MDRYRLAFGHRWVQGAGLFLAALPLIAADSLWIPPYEYPYADVLSPAVYHQRRQQLLRSLGPRSLLLVVAAERHLRNGDVYYPYRQNSWLWYLTGIPEPNTILLLSSEGIQVQEQRVHALAFIPERNPRHERWEGARMGPVEAERLLGITALPRSAFDSLLLQILATTDTLYLLGLPTPLLRLPVSGRPFSIEQQETEWLRERFPQLVARRGFPPLVQLRAQKDTAELRLLRRAIAITGEALQALWHTARPGMSERDLQILLESELRRRGAEDVAFPTIVAAGPNACILHYTNGHRRIADGDLVLIDCGAQYAGYAADITRTIPISGYFTAEQRTLYNIVLEAQDSAIAACRPGVPFALPHQRAVAVLERRLRQLGILDTGSNVRHYFPHATSHHLGLDVHDVGPTDTLRPGYVITVEPGVYVPPGSPCDQRWWGIGIRIEDVVHITDNGAEILSAAIPRRPEEVEALLHVNRP